MNTSEDKSYQILVVDDEPSLRTAIKKLLNRAGHEVQVVDSAEAALTLLEKNCFDLIITDYDMPQMKGNEFAAIIKQRCPSQPVIMATGNATDFHPSGKPSGGVDWILGKPFSVAELREAIGWTMARTAVASTTPDAPPFLADTPEVPVPNMPWPTAPGESRHTRVRK